MDESVLSIESRIYLRAAELVEQGHAKGVLFQDEHGEPLDWADVGSDRCKRFCYRGALMRARWELTGALPEFGDLGGRVWDWMHVGPQELVRWNNDPDTTAKMVAAKLREQAFATARSREPALAVNRTFKPEFKA